MKIKLISCLVVIFSLCFMQKLSYATTLTHNQATNIGCNVNASTLKNFTFVKILSNNASITVSCVNNNGDLDLRTGQTAQVQCIDQSAGIFSPTQLSVGNSVSITCNPASILGLSINKLSTAPNAIGSGICQLFAIAGTSAGTCKLQLQCGTSSTPMTIIDNVGAGC